MNPEQASLALEGLDESALERIIREADEDRDIRAAFEQFHLHNPGVYAALVDLCREARSHGIERVGIGMLWEILRWDALRGRTSTTDGYKLNNNHRAFYARLIMEQEADLEGIFETRFQPSEGE